MLNEKYQENSERIEKKSVGMVFIMEGYCFRVQCTFPDMENNAFLDEKWQ